MSTLNIEDVVKLINKPNPIIVEIGANVGKDSQRFLNAFPEIKLYCIEPDPRCIKKFEKRINDDRCILHKFAIADYNGKGDFYLSVGSRPGHKSDHINSSSIFEPTGHLEKFPWCKFSKTENIDMKTLDQWAKEEDIGYIDFIWADTQGGEKSMILGGSSVLDRTKYLYTEYSEIELYRGQIGLDDILKLLPSYSIIEKFSTNVLLRNMAIK